MKKTILFLLACLALPAALFAQQFQSFTFNKIELTTNTAGTPSLTISMALDLPNGALDADYYLPPDPHKPAMHVDYNGKTPPCELQLNLAVTHNSIRIKLSNLTEETLQRIDGKDNKILVVFDSDITFRYTDNSTGIPVVKYGIVSKDSANQLLRDQLSFPADQKTRFLTALNTMYYYKNSVDFGVQPGKDSSSVSYTLSFNFQNLYSAPSLLKCNPAENSAANKTLVYYGLSTRLSTDTKDSLNFVDIYPLIIHSNHYRGKVPYEWNLKVGHESNETFTTRRAAADGAFSMIIPNLIDLTSGASTRLRLKPVINFGLKGYYDYSATVSSFLSGQAYIGGYYYIPVYDHYAIILNDHTFYDFSTERNPKKQLASTYSLAVGTEVPGTGFKVMFKYEGGKSDINYKETKAVVIGLIMNLFNEKNNPGQK